MNGTNGTPQQNYTELVGTLVKQRDPASRFENEKLVVVDRETGTAHLSLVVREEYGAAQTIPLTVHGTLETVLTVPRERLPSGTAVLVTGRLAYQMMHDSRFASDRFPEGRRTTPLVLQVQRITPLDELDEPPPPGSYVVLEGTIHQPPLIRNHDVESALRVARTRVEVQMRMTTSRGLEAIITDRILVDIPLELTNAAAGLRQGNRVRIQGFLETYQMPIFSQRDPVVRAFLEAQERQWKARVAEAAGRETRRDGQPLSARAKEGMMADAQASVNRDRRSLGSEERLRVRVGTIALLEGEPGEVEMARATRRQWEQANPLPGTRRGGRASRNGAVVGNDEEALDDEERSDDGEGTGNDDEEERSDGGEGTSDGGEGTSDGGEGDPSDGSRPPSGGRGRPRRKVAEQAAEQTAEASTT
jgi:hypothetical protein